MKPEFVPWLWIIYVAYVLYKRYKENNRIEKSIILLAAISLFIVSGGFSLLIYYDISPEFQLILNIINYNSIVYNENIIWSVADGNNTVIWLYNDSYLYYHFNIINYIWKD
ncbi:MAG: hypothetical protein E6Z77_04810 [Veillonella sp.]|nr:hypothetical protein [Veillonella sp.]